MKIGFCAGSFDPIHLGHENLIRRSAKLCDKLVVGIAINYEKESMFSLDHRKAMVEAAFKDVDNIEVVCFDGLLAEYVHNHNYDCIFRGLRNSKDFDYELQLSQIYASYPDVPCETVFLMTDPKYSFISSTIVRENFKLGADVSNLVSDSVLELMKIFNK